MQIPKVSNIQSFGKTPVARYTLKTASGKEKVSATLYEEDVNNPEDVKDIKFSKTAHVLYSDIKKERGINARNKTFYIIQNDKTSEVICAAETSRHYRQTDDKTEGFVTVIEEMAVNKKYNNAAEPMLAHIAKTAYERCDGNVISSLDNEELPDLKRSKFSKTKTGEWILPEKRYNILTEQAEQRSQTQYLI